MDRTIPSFGLLVDIEKLEWKQFRKYLCRQDKKIFNRLFTIPKLYCHYLSDLANPIIIHSIFLAILFHNEKDSSFNNERANEGKKLNNLIQDSLKDTCQLIIDKWNKFQIV
jgi:YesN/AraC family two-component response regulator